MNMLQFYSQFYPLFQTLEKFLSDCGLKKKAKDAFKFFPFANLKDGAFFVCVYKV